MEPEAGRRQRGVGSTEQTGRGTIDPRRLQATSQAEHRSPPGFQGTHAHAKETHPPPSSAHPQPRRKTFNGPSLSHSLRVLLHSAKNITAFIAAGTYTMKMALLTAPCEQV